MGSKVKKSALNDYKFRRSIERPEIKFDHRFPRAAFKIKSF